MELKFLKQFTRLLEVKVNFIKSTNMNNFRSGFYGILDNIEISLAHTENGYEFSTNDVEIIKKYNFLEIYDSLINLKYYRLVAKRNRNIRAYRVRTRCTYKGWRYEIENIIYGKAILCPELETKTHLGLHLYDDRRIEVEYEKFMQEVEDIWEERTPIEGFKFDVEPIHYIKKEGKYLE